MCHMPHAMGQPLRSLAMSNLTGRRNPIHLLLGLTTQIAAPHDYRCDKRTAQGMSLLVGPTSMLAAFLPPTPLQLQYHHRLQPQPQANAPSSHHPPVAGKPSPLLRLHAAGSAHKGAEDDGGAGRQQQHYTRRRRQSSEGVFLGNLTRLELMGWDVLEPEEVRCFPVSEWWKPWGFLTVYACCRPTDPFPWLPHRRATSGWG